MRRLFVLAAAVLTLVGGLAPSVSARADAPYCGIRWGSLAKSDPDYSVAPITNVRAGRHQCFDRLVVDLGARPAGAPASDLGYEVKYVRQVGEDGSGRPVPLVGAADLLVIVHAPAHNVVTGRVTYNPANPARLVNVSGFSTFRQVAFAGDFEGQTTLGLGVRARLPFRVFVLAGPGSGSRLVIDVAHRW
jgi:hypothetical protein